MLFDDRLLTVLRFGADGAAARRVQYAQLVDLLGSMPAGAGGSVARRAFARLDELAAQIPAEQRLAVAESAAIRIADPDVLARFAADDPEIARAALVRARLDEAAWLRLIPQLPPRARGILRYRSDLPDRVAALLGELGAQDRVLPRPQSVPKDAPLDLPETATAPVEHSPVIDLPGNAQTVREPAGPVAENDRASDIGALVARIERFRKARAAQAAGQPPVEAAPRLPLGDAVQAARTPIELAVDALGRIVWAEGRAGPTLTGLSLADETAAAVIGIESLDPLPVALAIRRRQPFTARVAIAHDPALAGAWRLDAAPVFDPVTGRFTRFAARLRPATAHDAEAEAARAGGERMRELLHELKTPVNAIQGFAEVIQQQLFGPVPNEYRAHAATIASDAARMLAGFEELDRLAKLESGAMEPEPGEADLAAALDRALVTLTHQLEARSASIVLENPGTALPVALDPAELERMAWRLMATLAAQLAPGERIAISRTASGGRARLEVHLPAALAGRDDLYAAVPRAETDRAAAMAGLFGSGFTLRLLRAELRAAGGSMEVGDETGLTIELPLLTGTGAAHSA